MEVGLCLLLCLIFSCPQSQSCIESGFLKATSDLHLGRVGICFSVFISLDVSAAIVFVFPWCSFRVFSKLSQVWSWDFSCAHSIHSPQVISAGTKLGLVPGADELQILVSCSHFIILPDLFQHPLPHPHLTILYYMFFNFFIFIFLVIYFFISTCIVKFLLLPQNASFND